MFVINDLLISKSLMRIQETLVNLFYCYREVLLGQKATKEGNNR